MIRLVIFGSIGFLVGVGGGVGVSFMGAGGAAESGGVAVAAETEPVEAGDSLVVQADSTAADSTSSDTTGVGPEPRDIGREIAASLIRAPETTADSAADSLSHSVSDSSALEAGAGNAPAPAGAANADSTTDSIPSAGTGSAGALAGDGTDAISTPGELAMAEGAGTPGEPTSTSLPTLSESGEAGYRRMSRILAAMDATEAARVLDSLQDAEVRQLIGFLPARTAAAILAELDPARVARLGRGFWTPSGS